MRKAIFPICCALAISAGAQSLSQDSTFRIGRLDNGLTYYVRHNDQPPGVADFYLAQRVGSILEEPRQRGLAHFLEHMAFNGTENFPGNLNGGGVVPWCESVGIKFGANLNASTNVDQTIYNIASAPTQRIGVQDSCLLVLRDWGCGLLLTDEEIDKERGVIEEEWRSRRTGFASQRMCEPAYADAYRGSKYEDCLPIGNMDVVRNFEYGALRDYYHKWYRPDLQAVVVVGDIDADRIEQKIKEMFGSIPMPANAAERPYYEVPDNQGTIVSIQKDPGQPTFNLSLYFKNSATPDGERRSAKHLRETFIEQAIGTMLSGRLADLVQAETTPCVGASARSGQFLVSRVKDAISCSVVSKEGRVLESLSEVAQEVERTRQTGFTQPELDRAIAQTLNHLQKAANEADKRKNGAYVKGALQHFLYFEPLLSPAERLEVMTQITEQVTLDEVNAHMAEVLTPDNRVLIVYSPDNENQPIPTEAEFLDVLAKAAQGTYQAYQEPEISDCLVKNLPEPGTIVSETQWEDYGVTELRLSNGVRVCVKPTDYAADAISMRFYSPGGTSQYDTAEQANIAYITRVVTAAGVGDMDATTLSKALAGKTIKCGPSIGEQTEAINGNSSVKDFPTLMELTYLYFTSPRVSTDDFKSLMSKQESFIANRGASDKVVYNDSIRSILYGDHPRMQPMTKERLPLVDYDRCFEMYRDRFADASDFTMILIGNVDLDQLRPLLCQYIASLPSTGRQEQYVDRGVEVRRVIEQHRWVRPQNTPTAKVNVFYTADVAFNAKNDLVLDMLCQAMRAQYTERVREEQGASYGVGVNFDLDRIPTEEATLTISYNTAPEKYAGSIPVIYEVMKEMASLGPSEEQMDKTRKFLRKNYEQNLTNNGYWDYVLYNLLYKGVDFHKGYLEMVDSVTADDLRNMAKTLVDAESCIEITMASEPLEQ
ncbi:MAG: insulinase family protein [Bacteroidales bacterium]|nr:insulinase family protein [Bacteroidales bacterium]